MTSSSAIHGRRAELSCLLCGRMSATITQQDGDQHAVLQALQPEDTEAVRRLRCPFCGGRLMRGDNSAIVLAYPPLAPEDLHPRRGRPVTSRGEAQREYRARLAAGEIVRKRWARDYDACRRCSRTDSAHNGQGLCNRCRWHLREAMSS